MPRQRRPWKPGCILSIVGRGHEGRPLYATDDDRRFFVDRLRRVFVPRDVDLYAWALLTNHYHLMIRITEAAPETLFRRLNTSLGMRERRLRGDHGAVFQGRYWSRPCEEEGSVLAVLSYVLGNPARHGVVRDAASLAYHPWTAYPEILGTASPGLVDPGKTLALLHPDEATARGLLSDALAARVARWQSERAGIDVCEEPGCRGASDGCLLVHPDRGRGPPRDSLPPPCVPWRPQGISRAHDERAERRARLRGAGWRPSDLVAPVCDRLGAHSAAVVGGRRHPAACAARAVIAFVACDGVGLPGVAVA